MNKAALKVAVVGSGGREHAIIESLKKSPRCGELIAIPGNGGMQGVRRENIRPTDLEAVAAFCKADGVDYVVVAPDDPLALGMVNLLESAGIPCFGPTKAAARIEASKVFAKDLMRRYAIPTAGYAAFNDAGAALTHIRRMGRYPVVVKADGLALGKGVLICANEGEAEAAVRGMLEENQFGASGSRVVVEEFLEGPEVSVLAFCDGERLAPMVSSMDHKRALDGDAGPNTGGMGTVAPNPFYTPQLAGRCMREIYLPTLRAMAAEGAPFKGCLYFGLMLTADGPKVIEYNCRFGDPEAQVVLPLLESDLLEAMLACTEGRLDPASVRFGAGAAACVVMASGGYPGSYATGLPITGVQAALALQDVQVFCAGVAQRDGRPVTAGGRVLGVAATGGSLADAVAQAYKGVACIAFENAHCRRDIGGQALRALRQDDIQA